MSFREGQYVKYVGGLRLYELINWLVVGKIYKIAKIIKLPDFSSYPITYQFTLRGVKREGKFKRKYVTFNIRFLGTRFVDATKESSVNNFNNKFNRFLDE